MPQVSRDPQRVTPEEVKAKMDRGEPLAIIDVRSPSDYAESDVKIKGAIRIPPHEIAMRMHEIPRDREIVTYCT